MSSSSFAGRGKRRIIYSTSVVIMLIIMLLLQAGGAIRIFPSAIKDHYQMPPTKQSNNINKKSFKAADLVHKHLGNGRSAFGFNRSGKGSFSENKRRVPSCPDPLHN